MDGLDSCNLPFNEWASHYDDDDDYDDDGDDDDGDDDYDDDHHHHQSCLWWSIFVYVVYRSVVKPRPRALSGICTCICVSTTVQCTAALRQSGPDLCRELMKIKTSR